MRKAHSRRPAAIDAFTFVEVFAAMVFLAILVPAIVESLSIANRASVIAERGAIAGELAENKLNEIVLSSTGSASGTVAQTKGDFGTDWPGYRWETSETAWNQDAVNTMMQLNVQVYYPVQGAERSITLSTLVSGTAEVGGGL